MTRRVRAWPFLVAALALVVVLVGCYLFFVRSYLGQIVDERAKVGATGADAVLAPYADRFLDLLPLVCLGAGTLLAVVIGLARRAYPQLLIAVGVVAGANITTQLLKHVLLTRPDTGATTSFHNSFPSGHITVAASVSFALFLVATPRARPYVAALGGAFSVATGALLLASQWHRPSDIVAGPTIVAIWGCLGGAVAAWLRVPAPVRPTAARMRGLWWLAVGCGLLSSVALVQIYLSAAQHGSHVVLAFAGGLAAIAACVSALTATANHGFRLVA